MGIMHHKDNRLKSSYLDTISGRLSHLDFDDSAISSSASLSVSPSSYNNRDDLTVSWKDVACTHSADWIGVYAPYLYATSSSSYDGYIDWAYVADVSSTYSQGFGSMTFTSVMNLRSPLIFRYYSKNSTCSKNADSTWSLVISSPDISPVEVDEPTQAHLAFGDSYDSMHIMFVSNSSETSFVEYGTSTDNLTKITGSFKTYSANQMCSSPATSTAAPYFSTPGNQHKVTLTDLSPSTLYYYRYGVGNSVSELKSFTSAPSDTDITVKFAAFGDMGAYQTGTLGTIERLTEHVDEFDFILHIGDISYAEGEGIEWDVFGNIIEPIAEKIPYMVSVGNHEYDHTSGGENDPSGASGQGYHPSWGNYGSDSYGECGVPLYYRFSAPQSALSNAIFWYSFSYGPVLVIQMSSEHDFSSGSDQYNWLKLTLQTVDRSSHPWVILTTHRPIVSRDISNSMASIDEKSFTVVSTVRYKKLYKKVVKGELTTEELYKECMKLGIKGKASVEIIKDKSREFAKQDFRVQDIRSVLLSVLFNESIPKFIHIKNKPYIRDVIVMNIQDIDDPDRELSELSSNDIYSIKISNSSDHSPRFSTKLLSYSNEETVDDNEQTVATTDPSNKYNQYILSESMLRFWGYPMPNLDNCLDQSCKRQRLEEMSALVTETETSGVSTGIIPSHSTTNQLIKLLQSIDVVMKDNTSSGFYRTLDRDGEVYDLITYDKSIQPFTIASIDCEMCDTTNNRLEVTRVSIVNENNVVLLDTLVKPSAPITNYRTEFSGITEELLAPVSVSLAQVQLFLLTHITSDSIIVGHSLDSDLKALKISHNKCIDTSIIYPHVRGHPYKYKLKYLANHYLQLDIQRSGRCHDSIEDASAAMQLVQMKVINGPSYGLPKQSNEKRLSIFSSTKSRII
eukprot:gene18126-23780_t